MKNYQLTKKQYLNNLYSHMKERVTNPDKSVCGRHYLGLPICSRNKFIEFGMESNKFTNLFRRYKSSKGKRVIAPSIDRIKNTRGYTLDNIQFLTLSENSRKDRKVKWIVLKSLKTNKICRFSSTTEVGRFLNHKREVKVNRSHFFNTKTEEKFVNLTSSYRT